MKKFSYSEKGYNVQEVNAFIDEVIKTQKLHSGMIKYTLNKLDTNLFNINNEQIVKENNVYVTMDKYLENDEIEIDLAELFHLLLRHWWMHQWLRSMQSLHWIMMALPLRCW